jgi:Carboxypeptidase regulatory-like domain
MRFFYTFTLAVLLGALSSLIAPAQLCAQELNSAAKAASAEATQAIDGRTPAALVDAPEPQKSAAPAASADQPGNISGTVTDEQGDLVTGATVVLEGGDPADHRSQIVDDSGFFNFAGIKPGISYHLSIRVKGFENWTSQPIVLSSGQFLDVTGVKLKLSGDVSSVTVYSSNEQIATQQVEIAEQQRVLGFIPNFYVIYDSRDAVPLTTKLKFRMAFKVTIDPISIVAAGFMAGVNQAFDRPGYQQGMKGYAQRFGQEYADGVTDVMFGGAILPSLLHQDPRYYYQGTGTVKSRMLHALSNPFVCKGDNGHWQPNYSSVGGDLASSAIANLYYPKADRGVGPTFENVLITTAERAGSSLFQEFVLRKLTPSAKRNN